MRRGQTTLEYILLIGIVAAGIIAVIIYVSRGHQGRLRSQADQLSTGQYAPGNTTINNSESKNLASIANTGSSTTVIYGNMNEPNTELEAILAAIVSKWALIYELRQNWETFVVPEAIAGAVYVRANGLPWIPPENCSTVGGDPVNCLTGTKDNLTTAETELGVLFAAANTAQAAWPERTKDQTSSKSSSSETGKEEIHKQIDETLGDL
ncbi:MAG: class III signal peptide-containing protein [Candidatus Omnitrophota bacterium]|nr:class III signal peptide-containing protein [Candidatus Omnitrophota bacterium]